MGRGWVVNVDDPLMYATFSWPELNTQLLDPRQKPELTGVTSSAPKISLKNVEIR